MTGPLALALLVAASTSDGALSGLAKAIDGDSLMVGQSEVRLFGIDAPEGTQACTRAGSAWPCGAAAADQLARLVAGKQVNCISVGRDQHGRILGRCVAGGIDLNRTLVASGYALAYRRYSSEFVSAEESAKANKRGMWSGTFQVPSEFRHADGDHVMVQPSIERTSAGRELPTVSSARSKPQPSGNCRIKGNHSRKGERIYHLPGMPYYAETVAEELFCTEKQARAAGYRRSRADRHR